MYCSLLPVFCVPPFTRKILRHQHSHRHKHKSHSIKYKHGSLQRETRRFPLQGYLKSIFWNFIREHYIPARCENPCVHGTQSPFTLHCVLRKKDNTILFKPPGTVLQLVYIIISRGESSITNKSSVISWSGHIS